ncbi:TetR/AcrR family transcriptional regulator [Mycobacterium riyadhense]|uniref:TetR/AcrR family transcriptional regulator n=1 Tax=Mycobacterium riyadhense TaxID=486698 RepID=UPI001EF9CBBB|nr:TetR/AcrR family transcriptional regulator [Mycobacterium riyadhense]
MTVERILDAAAEVLKERGYDGASTNRIAEAAGISPGSLYQYFPNKDSILEALVAEYAEQLLDRVSRELRKYSECDAGTLIREAIAASIGALDERPEILRVISGHLPGHTITEVLEPLEASFGSILSGYTMAWPNRPVGMDVDAASWILTHLLGIAIRYVVDEPPIAKDVFVKEVNRLVMGHPLMEWLVRSANAG